MGNEENLREYKSRTNQKWIPPPRNKSRNSRDPQNDRPVNWKNVEQKGEDDGYDLKVKVGKRGERSGQEKAKRRGSERGEAVVAFCRELWMMNLLAFPFLGLIWIIHS